MLLCKFYIRTIMYKNIKLSTHIRLKQPLNYQTISKMIFLYYALHCPLYLHINDTQLAADMHSVTKKNIKPLNGVILHF